ncbi:MAG: hypothetical protein AMXMBFR81_25780 [Chthonomonas sp.]
MKRFAAFVLPVILAASGAAQVLPYTQSFADTGAWIGSTPTGNHVEDGPANRPTNAVSTSTMTIGGDTAEARFESWSQYTTLRAMGTITLDTGSTDAGGRVGLDLGGNPDTVAHFGDLITIGGGPGPHTFRVYYELSGSAGLTGPGAMTWSADLDVQIMGLGVSVLNTPQTLFRGGTESSAFGDIGFAEVSATNGSTMSLFAYMGGFMQVNRIGGGLTTGSLDMTNTGFFHIVPDDPNTTFTAASGANYLVPEPATLSVLALGLMPLLRRRPKTGSDL